MMEAIPMVNILAGPPPTVIFTTEVLLNGNPYPVIFITVPPIIPPEVWLILVIAKAIFKGVTAY